MDFDKDKVDEVVLALMFLNMQADDRAWKSFDWDTLNRLHDKGLILDPKNKTKSVVLTDEALKKSEVLFKKHFCS